MLTIESPITGAAQTGFTSPTYTVVADVPPDVNGKQVVVSALGGTQAGVDIGSVSRPFTMTMTRPKVLRTLGVVNPVTGKVPAVPMNTYKLIFRKGVTPLAGQPSVVARCSVILDIPAGSDTADAPDIRALLSASFGFLSQNSAEIGDTVVTGIL